MSITGDPGDTPKRVGISIGDLAAGLFATIGILADLYAREQTKQGDRLDIAMLDCQVALLENSVARYFATGKIPQPLGNRHASITPFEMFPTRDTNIIICAGNDKNWKDLCYAIERPELIEDVRFTTNDNRTQQHDALRAELCKTLADKTTKEWMLIFEKAGVPCGPVNTVADIVDNEQVLERNMIIGIDYPDIGTIKSPGCPIKSSKYNTTPCIPAPDLGANNEEILGNL